MGFRHAATMLIEANPHPDLPGHAQREWRSSAREPMARKRASSPLEGEAEKQTSAESP